VPNGLAHSNGISGERRIVVEERNARHAVASWRGPMTFAVGRDSENAHLPNVR